MGVTATLNSLLKPILTRALCNPVCIIVGPLLCPLHIALDFFRFWLPAGTLKNEIISSSREDLPPEAKTRYLLRVCQSFHPLIDPQRLLLPHPNPHLPEEPLRLLLEITDYSLWEIRCGWFHDLAALCEPVGVLSLLRNECFELN